MGCGLENIIIIINNNRKYLHGIYSVQILLRCLYTLIYLILINRLSGYVLLLLLLSLFHRGEIEAEKLENSEVPKLISNEDRT